jgi:microcystin-dependent protein
MEGYIGEIRMFAPNFAPKNWALCNGQLLVVNLNSALFSILGTTYGGDGIRTFALPDLRGRSVVCAGSGSGLYGYALGEATGSANTLLAGSQLPQHTHPTVTGDIKMQTTAQPADSETPAGNFFARDDTRKFDTAHDNVTMKPVNVNLLANAGASIPINNMMPFLAINYIICVYGIFPSRN